MFVFDASNQPEKGKVGTIMTYEKIFADLKKTMLKADTAKLEGDFAFQCVIDGDGEGVFYFALKDGVFSVEPYDYVGATATFRATAETYKNILAGKVTVDEAIAAGALEVDRPVSYADILSFFAKKAPAKKAPAKKAEAPKAAAKKAPAKKAEAPKAETKKAPAKKAEAPKAAAPKAEAKKEEAPKAPAKKAPAKKTEAPKAEVKKEEAPKAEAKKAEAPKAPAKKPAAKAKK